MSFNTAKGMPDLLFSNEGCSHAGLCAWLEWGVRLLIFMIEVYKERLDELHHFLARIYKGTVRVV